MTNRRISGHLNTGALVVELYISDCPSCSVVFGITADLEQRRRKDGRGFYCPNGHSMAWTPGKTDAEKLKDAEAREVALRDQLEAAVREAEQAKGALLRDRHRFANGVCPCCNRSFENVARHMRSQHPDYDVAKVAHVAQPAFECSCGRQFESLRGLHQHQTKQRRPGWYKPTAAAWCAHLTVV